MCHPKKLCCFCENTTLWTYVMIAHWYHIDEYWVWFYELLKMFPPIQTKYSIFSLLIYPIIAILEDLLSALDAFFFKDLWFMIILFLMFFRYFRWIESLLDGIFHLDLLNIAFICILSDIVSLVIACRFLSTFL